MAQATIEFPVTAGVPPDGTSGNNAPAFKPIAGTESSPKKVMMVAAFDPSIEESLYFYFKLPADYASAPIVKLQWMANTAANVNCVWGARIGALTPNVDGSIMSKTLAAATTATTATNLNQARRVIETSITLANLDSLAAGDLVILRVYRDATNGSDTLTVDAELISVTFEYTQVSSSTIATILLPLGAALPPDGSSGNLPPRLTKIQGTEANPKKHVPVAIFDPSSVNTLWWVFRWPDNFSSTMTLKLMVMANGTTGSIYWFGCFGAISPGDVDTPVEHAMGSTDALNGGVAAVARVVEECSFAINDINSAVAGDLVFLKVHRDPTYAGDTSALDGELITAALTYTKT